MKCKPSLVANCCNCAKLCVERINQVDSTNFYVLGHSWGGILATEYALKYGQNLKGLIISNMMASIPAYNRYADSVLMPAMNQQVLAEGHHQPAEDHRNQHQHWAEGEQQAVSPGRNDVFLEDELEAIGHRLENAEGAGIFRTDALLHRC